MLPLLNARQIKLLSETADGMPEPATAQGLRELAQLRALGLLEFDDGGRYEVTASGQARLASYRSAFRPASAAMRGFGASAAMCVDSDASWRSVAGS